MERALKQWTTTLQDDKKVAICDVPVRLSYTIHGCMLVLPHNAFKSPSWQAVAGRCTGNDFNELYRSLCKHLKVAHIAINNPIPQHKDLHSREENTIRAPQNFTPLFGDFGPATCSSPPTKEDFDTAFWVTAKQNNIYQTWSPRWTMFSRGNISEKARLLTLPSIQEAVERGRVDARGCAAVDLYAGVGYFAFSYLRAGVNKVLCWDINPWSIEGLKKGADANRWPHLDVTNPEIDLVEHPGQNEARLLIFSESNELASAQVQKLRDRLPPILHVNCGLLPTSRGSWQTSIAVLDPQYGGWMHVHENFAIEEIEGRAEEVRATLEQMVCARRSGSDVQLDCIHRLKSYAPGVVHCVLDIHVSPIRLG